MNQATHAWIAVRAAALLEENNQQKGLVSLLLPHASKAAIGAWIPDLADAKRTANNVPFHVLKMEHFVPKETGEEKRFIATKDKLVQRLSGSSAAKRFLEQDQVLDRQWWSQPYKADAAPGQHVANRAMGLFTALRDLLIIGEKKVDELVPGEVPFLLKVEDKAKTRAEQAALYFFMLSHFIADACMMCHCDARRLAGFDGGLHHELEQYWGKAVGKDFDQNNLSPDRAPSPSSLLEKARKVDGDLGISFAGPLPKFGDNRDVWLETVDACRASFAVMNSVVPVSEFPDSGEKRDLFEIIFDPKDGKKKALLDKISAMSLADAVANTAMVWAELWEKVSKE